ncbi:MAG: hypothetical protein RBR78_01460 [Flavobacteriaceae bacterium]|jgi:hypothetical protein|nr:hypothetical protein [Flavobacteriaceae bacterium]
MEKLRQYSFFIGILLFLIYDKVFFTLLSLNDIYLFTFKGNETLYIIGFIVSIILANVILVSLYKVFIKSEKHNLFIIRLLFILALIVVLFLWTNYYLGYLGRTEVAKHLQDIFFKYYDYKNTIYFINSSILLILYGWYFYKKK